MFKPMLAPNEKIDLKELTYPLLASYKIDGIRAIFMNGEMYSRSLKQLPNAQLAVRFDSLKKYSKEHNIILDGELWARSITFPELSGIIRQLDCILPDDLFFHCFDIITNENFDEQFKYRVDAVMALYVPECKFILPVDQWAIHSAEDTENLFKNALDNGYEGLILRNPSSHYKCGRGTIKENLIYKVKPFVTTEAQVIGVIQATEVNENVEKKTNELGRSKTSQKKDDRHLIEKASAVKVFYNGLELKVTLAFTNEEKEEIWNNQKNYIGKWIEYKSMEIGMKEGGLPRHPTSIRWRNDK